MHRTLSAGLDGLSAMGAAMVNGRAADRRWCVRRDRRNVRTDYEYHYRMDIRGSKWMEKTERMRIGGHVIANSTLPPSQSAIGGPKPIPPPRRKPSGGPARG
jgi:hypothetical protein